MEDISNIPKATFESVWAALQETDRMRKASASMKLDGGGMLEAKAGMVKIN